MTAHTPGPWVVNKDRRGAGKLYVREARLSEVAGATAGRAVAQLTAVVGSDEQLANATLVAAAPLLGALARQLVTTLDEHLSDGDLRLLRPEAVAQLDHLRSSALAALDQAGLSLPPG